MLPSGVHNVSLVYALVWAIDNFYGRGSSTPLAVVQFATSAENRGLHNDLIDEALVRSSGTGRIQFVLEDEHVESTGNNKDLPPPSGVTGRPMAIWFLDSLLSYFRLEMYLSQPGSSYKRNGYFVVVYTGKEDRPMNAVQIMFRRLLNMYVLNVNVFLHREGTVQLYTYYPYGPHRCQSSLPVYYTAFQNMPPPATGLGLNKPLFPSKLANMHGCPLVVVTFEQRPFVFIEDDVRVKGGRIMGGIEGMIFRSLAERMNFTFELVERQDKDRGQILPDGNFTGILKMMVDGEANVTFVCFMYNKARSELMLPSISYISFPILLIVPGGGSMTPMQRLTRPFRHIIWSCVVVSLFLGLALIALLRMRAVPGRLRNLVLGRHNRWPCLDMWNILVGGLALFSPRRNFARYLLLLWLLQTLVLRAAYSGQLFLLLQDLEVRSPLRSVSEVLAQGYEFHMLPALQTVFRDSMPSSHVRVIPTLEDALYRMRDEDDPGIAVPVLQPTVFQFDYRSGPNARHLTTLPVPLMTVPMTIYMRPHSYLKKRFDRLLMAMMSSGIVYRYRRMYLDRIERLAKKRNVEPRALTLWRLGGIFLCCGMLQLLAILVFVLEMFSRRHPRLRRTLNAINRFTA
ncbi:glutamate receptor ionotropic, NMDA 3B [Drosophila gunungcola]|uniref:Ionotropic glutamate receptor L-glutamate and glycine-binding domain-containing protein n=1 Tax=Drosophila gunungcola TaxID=103775 RepID=A0A9P9YE41_9MUSC|nr:glutamate receptor ionotropic, NMDA 3B [Drosophila gunungcola]KAI8035276.1 hypothetical protein M5D96_011933 [Drosophila gunungcola]